MELYNQKEKTKSKNNIFEIFKNQLRNTLIYLLAFLAVTQISNSERKSIPLKEKIKNISTQKTHYEMKMKNGETIKFYNWESFMPVENTNKIKPKDGILTYLTEKADNPVLQTIEPRPPEDKKNFINWIKEQIKNPEIQKNIEVNSIEEMSTKQAILFCVAIVIENLEYINRKTHPNLDKEKIIKILENTSKTPIDKSLKNRAYGECSHYSVAVELIFKEIKNNFPDKFKNTYITTNTLLEGGHVFNRITHLEKEDVISVTFIDVSSSDHIYGRKNIAIIDFLDFISSLEREKRISYEDYINMADELLDKKIVSEKTEWEFIQRDIVGLVWSNISEKPDKEKQIKFLKRFINKSKNQEWKNKAIKLLNMIEKQ